MTMIYRIRRDRVSHAHYSWARQMCSVSRRSGVSGDGDVVVVAGVSRPTLQGGVGGPLLASVGGTATTQGSCRVVCSSLTTQHPARRILVRLFKPSVAIAINTCGYDSRGGGHQRVRFWSRHRAELSFPLHLPGQPDIVGVVLFSSLTKLPDTFSLIADSREDEKIEEKQSTANSHCDAERNRATHMIRLLMFRCRYCSGRFIFIGDITVFVVCCCVIAGYLITAC